MKETIKLAIVDDNDSYRTILTIYLKKFKYFDIIISCSNGKELIEAMLLQKPDVVLLDLKMSVMSGVETTEYLNKHHPEIKILILTGHGDENISTNLIGKGANVFLLKDNGIEQAADAIYTLFKYEHYFADWSSKKIPNAKNEDIKLVNEDKASDKIDVYNDVEIALQEEVLLTEQEKTILKYLCEGLSNKEIADKLHLSLRTIENKRAIMFKKTKTNNIAKLIRFAQENKII
jgi:two-component system response regulator DegU